MQKKSLNHVLIPILIITLLSCDSGNGVKEKYPVETLENNLLRVEIVLPDKNKGYYRSSRFDWSATIAQVTFEEHTYFMPWLNDGHDSEDIHSGCGAAEEFREAVGYDEAKIGEGFIKVGVGVLEKTSDSAYNWEGAYNIIDNGSWEIERRDNSIISSQFLTTDFGYAYRYEKKITISEEEPKVVVAHCLENLGRKSIRTNPYCHNFFKFDNKPIDNNYVLSFNDSIFPQEHFGNNALFDFNSLKIKRELTDTSIVKGELKTSSYEEFVLVNFKTKRSVEVNYYTDPGFFYVYAWDEAFCPEPMVFIDIGPGESFIWNFSYTFF